MAEIVAERGYAAVKVCDVVGLAGVSTRAFYERFDGKEDCFLRTYELVAQRATQPLAAPRADEPGWRERLRRIIGELLSALQDEPHAARLAAIEVYEAGPAALERAWRAEREFGEALAEAVTRSPGGVEVSSLVVEGMVGGIAHAVRARLLASRGGSLPELEDELVDWAQCYLGGSAAALAELDLQTARRDSSLETLAASPNGGEGVTSSPDGDRASILSATARLVIASGPGSLTATRIRSGAGVPRRTFDLHFNGVEECFIAAMEQRVGEALAHAACAQAAARTWPGGIYRAISVLCDRVVADPILARVCLGDDFAPGSSGWQQRRQLIRAVSEQIGGGIPREERPGSLAMEATEGAVWALFGRHLIREWPRRRQVAATLAFLALAPVIGAPAAMASIRGELAA